MRFRVAEETALFGESLRGALQRREPPLEPPLGAWWDEHDSALAAELGALGWEELWNDPELLQPTVVGGIELGRALAPIALVDVAALGGPLALGGRVRHGYAAPRAIEIGPRGSLVEVAVRGDASPEATLDGDGTLRIDTGAGGNPVPEPAARLRVWGVATLGYLAGVAAVSLEGAVAYVKAREQFGAPLAALPAVQSRLADAALAAEGVELLAWDAAADRDGLPSAALLWSASACRDVTAAALQVHGAVGFALESGVHRAFRRAAAVGTWADAVVRAVDGG